MKMLGRMRQLELRAIAGFWLVLSGCTGVASKESPPAAIRHAQGTVPLPTSSLTTTAPVPLPRVAPELGLARAIAATSKGLYRSAEAELLRIIEERGGEREAAELALAEIESMTGRWDIAVARAQPLCRAGGRHAEDACRIAADVLRRKGDLDEAHQLLAPFADSIQARRVRLALADLLADRGQIIAARGLYHRLADDLGRDSSQSHDAVDLAIAGRAAHRLGAWREANEFFNRAEMTGVGDLSTLIWRGELYLDAHDPNRARAVAEEALRFAPEHPSALLLAARVRLAAAHDADQAERYLQQILATDPTRGDAYAVLVGLALRDLDLARVDTHLAEGLAKEPKHLELLSLRAVRCFLADDPAAFDAAVHAVLQVNPSHARVYRLVAEYAEAEHRYGDTIPLLRRAIALDPDDPVVRAQLGIQLLRSGSEDEGRRQLERAFAQNPFDLRVGNTLALYDRKIDKEYSSFRSGPFVVRVPNQYRDVLQEVVTPWLHDARSELEGRYGVALRRPLFVELYGDQDSFGVRSSGVPATFLQGVCFGKTISARLPTDEPTNLGMTLWHELSHVAHLQLSNQRVPRWFTEGLAEVETARRRPEWAREQDLSLHEALHSGRLPAVEQMNRAFTHAATLDELTVAYVASTYLVDYLQDTYGFERIRRMLRAWGQRKSTAEIFHQVLGTSVDAVNVSFRAELQRRLAHLDNQYRPQERPGEAAVARARVASLPGDPVRRAHLAHAELSEGRIASARAIIAQAPPDTGNHPDMLWVSGMVALADQQPGLAERALASLVGAGKDGYFVQMQLALLARMKLDTSAEQRALERAHAYHPTASEPLYRLAAMARATEDRAAELVSMEALARLEESDMAVHRRVVELSLELGRKKEAVEAAERMTYVNPLDSEAHQLRARTALANHDQRSALVALRHAQRLASTGGERKRLEKLLASVKSGKVPAAL